MYGKGAYGSPVESFPTPENWPPTSSSSETGGYVPPKGHPGREGQHQQYQQPSYYAPAPSPNSGSYPAPSPPGSYPPLAGSYPPQPNQVSYPPVRTQESYSAPYPPPSTPYPPNSAPHSQPSAPYPQLSAPDPYNQGPYPSYPSRTDPPQPSTPYPPNSAPNPQPFTPDPYHQGPYPSYPPRTDPPLPIFPPKHPTPSPNRDKPPFGPNSKEDVLDPYLNNEIHQVANLFYKDLSAETKKTVNAFFKNMDKDGDGLVTLRELQQALPGRKVEKLFRFLDKNNSGDLNFWEVVTFYYIFHYKPNCDHCGEAILGTYYSCAECWLAGAGEEVGESFDLCISCYSKKDYFHPHDDLLDHNMLLGALRRIITVSDADAKKKVKGENSLLEELILQMAALAAAKT